MIVSQVDFRVGQLLAVNPDSPLRVPKKREYQVVKPHLWRVGGAYRKTTPLALLIGFLPVNVAVLFVVSLGPIDVA